MSHARQARSGSHRAPDSPPTVPYSVPVGTSRPVDCWPGWSSALALDPRRSSRIPASRVEVSMTSTASTRVASLARPMTCVSPGDGRFKSSSS
ncbi:hypothetical protein AMTR_s00004p00195270 [Amborella trichopoda]|uniref:Uncharacterized protein n=1 Tax=Amborella trichopoda TaxID=13333 RepID=W1NDK6_AMBTC|nr:hypothetical protein AMTR_s00004p00195270 [Amborella trichopoda]